MPLAIVGTLRNNQYRYQGRTSLDDHLFLDDAVIFDPVISRYVQYGAGDGPEIAVAVPDRPMLGIWTLRTSTVIFTTSLAFS